MRAIAGPVLTTVIALYAASVRAQNNDLVVDGTVLRCRAEHDAPLRSRLGINGGEVQVTAYAGGDKGKQGTSS